jgi:hypothetical protein
MFRRQQPLQLKESLMKEVEKKDEPDIAGGIRVTPGDGCIPTGPLFPDFPQPPMVPPDPVFEPAV